MTFTKENGNFAMQTVNAYIAIRDLLATALKLNFQRQT